MSKKILYSMKLFNTDLHHNFFNEHKDMDDKFRKNKFQSPVQMIIVDYLLDNIDKDISQKDLEEVTNIRKSSISGILDTMEKNDIIKRISDKNDARKKNIVLTKEAKAKHKEMLSYIEKLSDKLIKGISKEEIDFFCEILDKMRNNLKDNKEEK